MYHRVETRNREAERPLLPAIEEDVLAAQLRLLRAHHEVVPPSLLLRAVRKRRRWGRFPVAITFDDDLPTHPTAAALLRQIGLPAGFFLSGASLAAPFRFWWELLEEAGHGVDSLPEVALGRSVEGEPTLPDVAEQIGAMSPHERDAVSNRLRGVIGPDPEDSGLRADEVQALAAAGFEIGFHTLRHDAMPPLDDEGLTRALTEGRDALSEAVGREPTMLAYPHGEADRRVAAAARAAGYELAFTGEPSRSRLRAHRSS